MKISIHPLFFAVLIFSALFGGLLICIICVLTALLHECGHIFCAARYGYECERIRLMPYGAAAVCDIDGISAADEIKLALAGPAVNAAICVATAGLWWFFPQTYAYTDIIMYASLAMLAVNLLPAYPLDGGRVAGCLLSRLFGQKIADVVLRVLNLIVASALAAAFFFCANATLLVFALFLLCSAFEKRSPAVRINFSSPSRLRRGQEIKCVLVDGKLTVLAAVRLLDDKRYLILRNRDDGSELTQDQLYAVISERGIYDSVWE